MWYLLLGAAIFLLPGAWAARRAPKELTDGGRISMATFFAVFVAYVGHGAVTILAAWNGVWPVALSREVTIITGAFALVLGLVVYGIARVQFRSFHLTWGLDASRLITSGIYRYSRNPQSLGALLALTGTALIGNSGAALLLSAITWIGSLAWLPQEERILARRFGERYERYRQRVPRWIGRRITHRKDH